jgi:hypothetical protein
MDLSRIESLTREMLEAEARRRGIKSPEFRTRTELVRLIVRHQYGGQLDASRDKFEQGVKTVQLARELVGTAVTAALGAIPARFDVLGLWSGKRTLPREHEEPKEWTPPAAARPAPPRPSARANSQPPASAQDSEPRASFAPLSMTPQTGEAARRPSSLPPSDAVVVQAEPPAPVPLREQEKPSAPRSPSTRTCEGEPNSGLLLRWAITHEGERRARAVLGVSDADGELTVRLVSIRPDAERIVRSEITEHGPVSASGEWSPGPLLDAERCVAAIGMRAGGRFVSIVHVQPQAVASV